MSVKAASGNDANGKKHGTAPSAVTESTVDVMYVYSTLFWDVLLLGLKLLTVVEDTASKF